MPAQTATPIWHVHLTWTDVVETLPPHLQQLAKLYNNVPFDRFGFAEPAKGMQLHPRSEYKFKERSLKPYGDICFERAKELRDRDVPLLVYWSGGIDSTVVLASLIQVGADFKVMCNKNSVFENKPFYDRFIKGKYETVISDDLPAVLKRTNADVITGELNDQLFGSDVMHKVVLSRGHQALLAPSSEANFIYAMTPIGYTEENAALIMRDAKGSAATQGIQLRTVYDVLWWINFAWKWQNVTMRMLMYGSSKYYLEVDEDDFSRVHHFFETEDFQTWSCSQHERKYLDKWPTYKTTAKRFIYRFDENEDYLNNATKVISLRVFDKGCGLGIVAPFKVLKGR